MPVTKTCIKVNFIVSYSIYKSGEKNSQIEPDAEILKFRPVLSLKSGAPQQSDVSLSVKLIWGLASTQKKSQMPTCEVTLCCEKVSVLVG